MRVQWPGVKRDWQRGLAGLRANTLSHAQRQAPPVWRAPEGPEGTAAGPVGGGGAWPGFETTRRARLAARTARGRAAAHGRTKQPGPTAGSDGARNTSGATNTNTNTDTPKRAGTLRFRPALDAQW